jgi:hypothetical protein
MPDTIPHCGSRFWYRGHGDRLADVHELRRQKLIPGKQIVPCAPWQIPVDALDSASVQVRVRKIKERN